MGTRNGFHVYRDNAGEWRWRRFSQGRVISESGEGYLHKEGAVEMVLAEAEAHDENIFLPGGEMIDMTDLGP